MEAYLYHGIKWDNYNLLFKILQSGYILPRCDLEKNLVTDENNIFNGTKFISLCQKNLGPDNEYFFKSSFNDYIFCKPNLVLNNSKLRLIYPYVKTRFEIDNIPPDEWETIVHNDDDDRRISCYIDEVQTKDRIDLKENLIAIGIPMFQLGRHFDREEIKKFLNKVKETLIESDLDVPIVNSSIYNFADNKENIKTYSLKI